MNLFPDELDPQTRSGQVTGYLATHPPKAIGFDAFWQAYPRKVSKKAALKAWLKLRPSPELQATILKALDLHKKQEQWKKNDGEFVPHAATWLNGEKWEDEVKVPGSTKASYSRVESPDASLERENRMRKELGVAPIVKLTPQEVLALEKEKRDREREEWLKRRKP